MRVAILDPFSGIAGDMTLGALIAVGLDPDWLRRLPSVLGLDGVEVRIQEVLRGEIACWKVDFDIPPQPHGRHIRDIRALVAAAGVPATVRQRADAVFTAIAEAEAGIHGTTPDDIHLHEVGAVDAILDVVGVVWALELLGIQQVRCGTISVGDGTVMAAHGLLPVPAPATLHLLAGHRISPGPPGSGELVTPTGAALVRVLSAGPPPAEYVPVRNGFGAGTKDFRGRANALRLIVAEVEEGTAGVELVELVTDVDDMPAEYLAGVADLLRERGALECGLLPVTGKRGRLGTRVEVLSPPGLALELEEILLRETTTIGVRRRRVYRRALPRTEVTVEVDGQPVRVKVVTLPDGSERRKPEFLDVQRAALATGRPLLDIFRAAAAAPERV
jgi:pyridinium-3,5-bisthiocarboxylic acid mononucleotide nickel chelatase